MSKSGEEGKPIIWRGAGDGEVVIHADFPVGSEGYPPGSVIDASDQHDVWFEHITVRGQAYSDIMAHNGSRIVIRRCKFEPFLQGIYATKNDSGKLGQFFISDNIVQGSQPFPATAEQWKNLQENRGIWVGGVGNVICYNRVDHCKDGIDMAEGSTPEVADDVHNNEVSNCYDDGAEMDGSYRNCRNFNNRYVDTLTGISFQPIHGGPIYCYRNVFYNVRGEFLKLHNSPSGAVLINNTFVHHGPPLWASTKAKASNCMMRNNLFVGTRGSAIEWDMRFDDADFDYDGFTGFSPKSYFLKFAKVRYQTLDEVHAKAPIEKHAVAVDPENLFASGIQAPEVEASYDDKAGGSGTMGMKLFDPQKIDLRLNPKSNAVGAGEDHADLGAYPVGSELPHYGPRAEK